jgi:nucleotide-binding universal stress UspA family protein
MDHVFPSASIIVGVDGSDAAVRAAIWATDEAITRDIPLRLVHVISRHPDASLHSHDLDPDYARAERLLHQAWTAVEATGEPVKLEMEILRGEPASLLIHASRFAAMLCIGWTDTSHSSSTGLGSIASALSRTAHCTVAVIRGHPRASLVGRWIIAKVDESTSSEAVLRQAVDEARLRRAPLLALTAEPGRQRPDPNGESDLAVRLRLDRYLAQPSDEAGEPSVCSLPLGDGVLNYLADNAELAQLVVVGTDDPRLLPESEMIGSRADAVLRNTNCSVMSVR